MTFQNFPRRQKIIAYTRKTKLTNRAMRRVLLKNWLWKGQDVIYGLYLKFDSPKKEIRTEFELKDEYNGDSNYCSISGVDTKNINAILKSNGYSVIKDWEDYVTLWLLEKI